MSDLDILIQEIARIALEDEATTQRIAHELGETDMTTLERQDAPDYVTVEE